MKRLSRNSISALFLAGLLALSLGACGKKAEAPALPPQGDVDESGNYTPTVPDVKVALGEAQAKNAEVVGWLQLPNTAINEAVVQAGNNDYYLRRDVNKKYAYEGSYYMDYESVMFDDGADLARNTIIYGHNLGKPMGVKDDPDDKKFAQLFKLDDIELAKKTPYVYLTTKGATHIFELFAVFYCEANITPVPYHYADYSDEQFVELVADAKKRSLYSYDVAVGAQDKIVTLSTCSYKYGTYTQNPDQRYVVMARLMRPGDRFAETAALTPNAAIKQPPYA